MKFSHKKELDEFLREKHVFSEYCGMHEIYTGGASYNFHVITKKQEYFLKVIDDEKKYRKLSNILQTMKFLVPIEENGFLDYRLLAEPYIRGHKIRYRNFTAELFDKMQVIYANLQNIKKSYVTKEIKEGKINSYIREISDKFMDSNHKRNIWFKFIRHWFDAVKESYVFLPPSETVIHGDLTANNVLVYGNNNVQIIDFDYVQYGNKAEDLANLIMQLAGFRGMFGSLRKFKKMMEIVNEQENFGYKEWLYGVQLFYLRTLKRKLHFVNKPGWRKDFCFMISLLGYFRIYEFLGRFYKIAK